MGIAIANTPNMEIPEQLRPGEHGNLVEDNSSTGIPEESRWHGFNHDNGGHRCPVSLYGTQGGHEEGLGAHQILPFSADVLTWRIARTQGKDDCQVKDGSEHGLLEWYTALESAFEHVYYML